MTTSIQAPFGVVDMGSNGIRFAIVRTLARHLPVEYEERAPISLLEAQGDEHVIPDETIDQVISSFRRFQTLCQHANVDPQAVHVIATEATRTAANAEVFKQRIHDATGWDVTLLSKQEEALISASGIVGAFYRVNGVTMDLGGGSLEISYVIMPSTNSIQVAKSPVSLPYGAALLKRRLAKCETQEDRDALYEEIVSNVRKAMEQVKFPKELEQQDGLSVYMSGGGLRALGYLSMSTKAVALHIPDEQKRHAADYVSYPIPIINGYTISGQELHEFANKYMDMDPEKSTKNLRTFRVSKRRAGMVPAICFLMSALLQVIKIKQVYFSEGGVRQGFCYRLLTTDEQRKDPLIEGARVFSEQSPHALAPKEFEAILSILEKAIPVPYMDADHPLQLCRLLPTAIYLANLTSHYPKETRAFVAFHMPLASGPLANVPGISHHERAVLALLLAFRQGGQVPDPIFSTVQRMVGTKETAVCKFVGRLMELVFTISPLKPGLGVQKSGIAFETVLENEDASTPSVASNESGDEEWYPRACLKISLLPPKTCPLVYAPAVISVIESLGEKINSKKKFDMDEEQRSILESQPSLFSVKIETPCPLE